MCAGEALASLTSLLLRLRRNESKPSLAFRVRWIARTLFAFLLTWNTTRAAPSIVTIQSSPAGQIWKRHALQAKAVSDFGSVTLSRWCNTCRRRGTGCLSTCWKYCGFDCRGLKDRMTDELLCEFCRERWGDRRYLQECQPCVYPLPSNKNHTHADKEEPRNDPRSASFRDLKPHILPRPSSSFFIPGEPEEFELDSGRDYMPATWRF